LLDLYFNSTSKSILIDKLQYVLIRFFDHLVVDYFFGPPCIPNGQKHHFAILSYVHKTPIDADVCV